MALFVMAVLIGLAIDSALELHKRRGARHHVETRLVRFVGPRILLTSLPRQP